MVLTRRRRPGRFIATNLSPGTNGEESHSGSPTEAGAFRIKAKEVHILWA